jgi:cytochrome c
MIPVAAAITLVHGTRCMRKPGLESQQQEPSMNRPTLGALIVLAAATTASLASAQDVAAGKSSFNKCLACHSIGENAKNKVGPELNGLNGRKSGTAPGYSYSDANKNSGLTWDEATFKDYIKNPKAKIPGTKMAFAGITKESEVNDLWAFVAQFDADGKIKP